MKTVIWFSSLLMSLSGCATIDVGHSNQMQAAQAEALRCQFDAVENSISGLSSEKLDYSLTPHYTDGSAWSSGETEFHLPKALLVKYAQEMKAATLKCASLPEQTVNEIDDKLQCFKREKNPTYKAAEEYYYDLTSEQQKGLNKWSSLPLALNTDAMVRLCNEKAYTAYKARADVLKGRIDGAANEGADAAQKAKDESPEGISASLCEVNARILYADRELARERSIAQEGGVADKNRLYNLAKSKINAKEYLESKKPLYRKAGGTKDWTPDLCK